MPPAKELTLESAISRLNKNHEDEAAQDLIRKLIGTKKLLCVGPEGQLLAAATVKSINFAKAHDLNEMKDRLWLGEWLQTKTGRSEASPCTGLVLFEGETVDPSAPTENWTGVEMPRRFAIARARILREEKARDGESVSEAFRTGELEAAHKRWLKEWGELARKIENETATDEELQLYQRAKNACYYRKGPEASAAADKSFPEVELKPEVRTETKPQTASIHIAGNVTDSTLIASTGGAVLGGAPVTNAIVDRGRVLLPGKAPLLYLVYDSADAAWAEKVKKNFFLSEKNGLVEIFDVSKIPPGAKREELLPQVHRFAKVIAYLASGDLLSWLDFREIYRLSPNARHVPVLLRPCAHKEAFGDFTPTPQNGVPITQWAHTDQAIVEVVQELKKILAA